jgi:hypothetical protein
MRGCRSVPLLISLICLSAPSGAGRMNVEVSCTHFLKGLPPDIDYSQRYNLIFSSRDENLEFSFSRLIAIPILDVLSAQFTIPNMVMIYLRQRMVVNLNSTGEVQGYNIKKDLSDSWRFRGELLDQIRNTVDSPVSIIPRFGFKTDRGAIISLKQIMEQIAEAQEKLAASSNGKSYLVSPIYLTGVFTNSNTGAD